MTGDSIMEQKKVNFLSWPVTWLLEVKNFKVVKASPYIITLNLTNAGKYTYSMEETTIELSSSAMTLLVAIRVVMVGSRKLMIAIR